MPILYAITRAVLLWDMGYLWVGEKERDMSEEVDELVFVIVFDQVPLQLGSFCKRRVPRRHRVEVWNRILSRDVILCPFGCLACIISR